MRPRRKKIDHQKIDAFLSKVKGEQAQKADTYRERALALFPHVCGRCGREFDAKNLQELTVHHIDHNHHNNPPDGSNWELLCVHCHDDEHQNPDDRGLRDTGTRGDSGPTLAHNPFGALKGFAGGEEGTHDEGES
jgi:5-methylcytosine-specific restriction endonuclease McrA